MYVALQSSPILNHDRKLLYLWIVPGTEEMWLWYWSNLEEGGGVKNCMFRIQVCPFIIYNTFVLLKYPCLLRNYLFFRVPHLYSAFRCISIYIVQCIFGTYQNTLICQDYQFFRSASPNYRSAAPKSEKIGVAPYKMGVAPENRAWFLASHLFKILCTPLTLNNSPI